MTIGTCSICGGPVTMPDHWGGNRPPIPTCESCGAQAANPFGPTIPMTPKPGRFLPRPDPAQVGDNPHFTGPGDDVEKSKFTC